jgi:hypothetical protein
VGSSIVRIAFAAFILPTFSDALSLLTANRAFCHSVRVFVRHCGVALTLFRSFTVILGWILGKPLTLLFDPFESIVLFLSGEVPYQLSLQPGCPLTAFLVSFNRQLRCTRWQIKLARGHDPDVYV